MYDFTPEAFESLRKVPLYDNLIKETFERCLDLYICPRVQRKKINIAANQLIPDMPNPSELKPFPSKVSVEYKGHNDSKVRCISVSPCGKYLASGDEAGNVFLWDVKTGRIRHKYQFEGIIDCVRFNPNPNVLVLAIVNLNHLYIVCPQKLYTRSERRNTQNLLSEFKSNFVPVIDTTSTKKPACKWEFTDENDRQHFEHDLRVKLEFEHIIKKVDWHSKGDYFATLADNIQTSTQVLIHSLSKAQTQKPFSKSKGIIETVAFHPTRPLFFVCNDQQVFCYNLQKQVLTRKFHSGARMISSIALHPKGENFVIGSYDKKLMWFDLEIGNLPYKKMKYHSKAIRNVDFSNVYPLFASASDDGSLNVFHGQVYEESAMNPLIVPVKILKGHGVRDKLGVLDCIWHPDQPWLFSAGADGRLLLWV
jgi:ribosome biogenesis protein ERB1